MTLTTMIYGNASIDKRDKKLKLMTGSFIGAPTHVPLQHPCKPRAPPRVDRTRTCLLRLNTDLQLPNLSNESLVLLFRS